jgi:hypothetical protein
MGLAAGALALALCRLRARRSPDVRDHLVHVLMLFSAWVVLFGPATEACTYAVIAPAIAWALIEAFGRPGTWGRRVVLIASLLLMGPVATDMFGSTVRLLANHYGSQPVGGLLFLIYLVVDTVWGHGLPAFPGTVPGTAWTGSVVVFPETPGRSPSRGSPLPEWTASGPPLPVDASLPCAR